MIICHIVGARPNFVKAAPVYHALQQRGSTRQLIVHTGQHYDINMSDVFFQQLGIPAPDANLQVGSGSHGQQTAQIMSRLESVFQERKPDLVIVYGDVNSTMGAALVCAKLGIPVGHVEAGLRSFDRRMPEEINRLLTDQLSDLLFTPSPDGSANLFHEGLPADKIHLVGNVMIDTLVRMLPLAREATLPGLPDRFALVTLHRAGNVGDFTWLVAMLNSLARISHQMDIVFPVHPRTRLGLLQANGSLTRAPNVILMDPIPYVEFLGLQTRAAAVITDSGGIQEETTYLGIPCFTVRENTERPITVSVGTNVLVGRDPQNLEIHFENFLAGNVKLGKRPALWDGHAAERIAAIICER
jgi:UDP-N-acetylglucosamine 2-epimerase (non-hydrolysing)